jgi:hypothetical protein
MGGGKTLLPGPVVVDNVMILLLISSMIGRAVATAGLNLSRRNSDCQILVPPAPRCHQDDGLSVRPRVPAGSNRAGKDFSFLNLPSGACSRDMRLFLIPNH